MGAIRPPQPQTMSQGNDDGEIVLKPGQQLVRTINADKFTMRTAIIVEKNCVLKSEQLSWYDPISDTERSRSQNEKIGRAHV